MARRSDHSRDELKLLALEAARALAETGGLRAVTARGVARRIGYSVGAIYNVFADLDDLILHMNGRTLDDLHAFVTATPTSGGPETALRDMAARYADFVDAAPLRWSAVMAYRPRAESRELARYRERADRVLALAETAIAGFFGDGGAERAARARHALVLWSGLYGIHALAELNGARDGAEARALVKTLIDTYVDGLRGRWGAPGASGAL